MRTLLLTMSAATVIAGCAGEDEIAQTYDPDTSTAVVDSAPGSVASAVAVFLTGENIVALLDTMYAAAEEGARIAMRKAQSEDVRTFAEQAAARHRAARQELVLTARQHNISPLLPDEDELAKQREAMEALQRATGAEFDRVYIEQSLRLHEGLYDELEDARNEAGNREIVEFLDAQRRKLATELQALRALRDRRNGNGQRSD